MPVILDPHLQQLNLQLQRTRKHQVREHTQHWPPGCRGICGHREPDGSGTCNLIPPAMEAPANPTSPICSGGAHKPDNPGQSRDTSTLAFPHILPFLAVVEPVTQETPDGLKVSTIPVPQVATPVTLAAARRYDFRGISSDKGSRQHL